MASCISVEKTMADYLLSCEIESGMTKRTLEGKKETLSRLSKFLNNSELSPETFRGYIAHLTDLGWKPSSIVSDSKVVRAFISWHFEGGSISENWGQKVKLPKLHREEIQIVPFETAQKIIEAGCEMLKTDNKKVRRQKREAKDCLIFASKSGLRNFELRGLKADDFNLEEKTFWVFGKGGHRDKLPIANDLVKMLRPRINRGGLLFRVSEKMLQNSMIRGCVKLNIKQKIRVHSLRHVYATTLLRDGVPYGQARRLMRHTDTRILDTVYSHLNVHDLAISLNGTTIVPQGLSPKEKLERITKLVQDELNGDERFMFSYETDHDTLLSLSIQLRN